MILFVISVDINNILYYAIISAVIYVKHLVYDVNNKHFVNVYMILELANC